MTKMYMDQTSIYLHAKTRLWFTQSCLTLHISKTVCLHFSIRKKDVHHPDILVTSLISNYQQMLPSCTCTIIFPHVSYCISIWSQAGKNILKPMYSLYKYTLKVLEKKCQLGIISVIISNYNVTLTIYNVVNYANTCLMYKQLPRLLT